MKKEQIVTESTMDAAKMEEVAPSKYRTIKGKMRLFTIGVPAISILVGIVGVFHIRVFGYVLMDVAYLYLLAGLFLPLCFIWIPPTKNSTKDKVPWYDSVIALISLLIPLYFFFETPNIIQGWVVPSIAPTQALICSIVFWALAIEAARRAVGGIFAVILLFFSTYPLYGAYMPGVFNAKNFDWDRVALFHALGVDSFVGIPLHVFGRLFFGYMTFALALQACGVGDFFKNIAIALLGKTRGGNAKVAILASGLFGSISGHPGANIFATGAFTIPAMKKEGFTPEFAGAVEACASTGGSLMPPIMGAVAFIMAEFLEMSYATICIAATVPSFLYYLCLFAQIDAYAAKHSLSPIKSTIAIPPIRKILWEYVHLLAGFVVLFYFLFYMRLESWAPWVAALATFAVAALRKQSRLSFRQFLLFFEDLGKTLGQMMGIMGPVGMIIGAFILTGIAYSLPQGLVSIAGGNIFLLLLMGAFASFILGMGVSVSACYIFLAITLAPALEMAGLNRLAVHMFILYCGLWSNITPPVALSAFTAAIISGGDPMKTALESMRIGVAKFLLPFFFVLSPAMLFQGAWTDTIQVVPTAAIGLILISGGLEGYFWKIGKLKFISKALLVLSGVLLGIPETTTDLIGVALAIIVLTALTFRKKRMQANVVAY